MIGNEFKNNVYGTLNAKDPTKTHRDIAIWYLDSLWTLAHLTEKAERLTLDHISDMPSAIDLTSTQLGEYLLPIPQNTNINYDLPYLVVPVPHLEWSTLLKLDANNNHAHLKHWSRHA